MIEAKKKAARQEPATGINDSYKGNHFTERSAIAHLKALFIQELEWKYPSLPYYTSPKFTASKTNGLTKCIIQFLKLNKCQAERISCEGRILDQRKTVTNVCGIVRTIGSITRVKASATRGTADISATIKGRSVKIEVKNSTTGDRQSEAQKHYQKQVEEAGGVYIIATSFPQFLNWYYSNFGGER
jgi:hypothetical protein